MEKWRRTDTAGGLRSGFHRVYWRNAGWPDNMARPSSTHTYTTHHTLWLVESHMGINVPVWRLSVVFLLLLLIRACLLPFFSPSKRPARSCHSFPLGQVQNTLQGASPCCVVIRYLLSRRYEVWVESTY